ncbi:hypothetical protein T265_10672 [Opisthorchis viverrini]|uniref:Uncharacterized protein n=1 Tax=Opisthorchis viverrini TaxID=6198 RepID=A0A075A0B4_OPIVI|nr:hypothetical protein T265_10672 [Opisthorchis viverrini]KER20864.1 hypothetical protein T265_10672 [Opisthorchis viverrini]
MPSKGNTGVGKLLGCLSPDRSSQDPGSGFEPGDLQLRLVDNERDVVVRFHLRVLESQLSAFPTHLDNELRYPHLATCDLFSVDNLSGDFLVEMTQSTSAMTAPNH